jgi:hypothetical protein
LKNIEIEEIDYTVKNGISKETKRIIKLAEEIREQNRRFKRQEDEAKLSRVPKQSGLPQFKKKGEEAPPKVDETKTTNYKYQKLKAFRDQKEADKSSIERIQDKPLLDQAIRV